MQGNEEKLKGLSLNHYISEKALAKLLEVSEQVLRNYRYQEDLPYIKIGRRIFFEQNDFAVWAYTHRRSPALK